MMKVIKRDGTVVEFNPDKIKNAIMLASNNNEELADSIMKTVTEQVNQSQNNFVEVESIQDMVEYQLMKSAPEVAKSYITYRAERNRVRDSKTKLMKSVKDILACLDIQNSNANVDEYSFGGRKKEASDVIFKELALNEFVAPELAQCHRDGMIYIHDLSEYVVGMHNCLFADISRLLNNGFTVRNGDVRPANSIFTACQLLAVIFQIQSQCQFGGVASAHIDYDLAPFVRKSFLKHYKTGVNFLKDDNAKVFSWDDLELAAQMFITNSGLDYSVEEFLRECNADNQHSTWNFFQDLAPKAYEYAISMLEAEGMQAAQSLYHNLNTLESRAGSQVPFTSINFGTDTSWEGRLVSKWCLEASIEGIGANHQTPIFPISIFQHKSDINDKPGTPNYDLKCLAIKSLSKRIYPNFVNCDWVSNIPDMHPIKFINNQVYHNTQSEICIKLVQGNKLIEDEHILSISDFVKSLDITPNDDGVIDLRTLPNDKSYLIQDGGKSIANRWSHRASNSFTKIHFIQLVHEGERASITTESTSYVVITHSNSDHSDKVTYDTVSYEVPDYDFDTEMATMGCRTLIGYDVNGLGYKKTGRGNVTPLTLNLAHLGILHGICIGDRNEPDVEGFFGDMDKYLEMMVEGLIARYNLICSQDVRSGLFMYKNGTIAESDAALESGIEKSMRHGSNALGYIGLANACYAMFGKYPHEDAKVEEFAEKVVKKIYEKAVTSTEKYHLNFSAYATPAESCCKTLAMILQSKYGKIPNVCDRTYLTNSHHVPVYENITIQDKLEEESKFAYMAKGGCITYIELNSAIAGNPKAVHKLVDYAMSNKNIPYFAINFPIDTCSDCGHSGDITDKCPACGSDNIIRLRRVTGYLTTDYRKFNKGKFDESNDRVKHG